MGRSVSHLSRAIRIAYFEQPKVESFNEDAEEYELTDEYEDFDFTIECIQESIKSKFPEFSNVDRWDGNEDHIILEGYGTEIGISSYCGLCALSIRVDDSILEYAENDEESDKQRAEITDWIEKNWDKVSQGYNQLQRVGGFSNGESVYERRKG
jgi:hypothetical protein